MWDSDSTYLSEVLTSSECIRIRPPPSEVQTSSIWGSEFLHDMFRANFLLLWFRLSSCKVQTPLTWARSSSVCGSDFLQVRFRLIPCAVKVRFIWGSCFGFRLPPCGFLTSSMCLLCEVQLSSMCGSDFIHMKFGLHLQYLRLRPPQTSSRWSSVLSSSSSGTPLMKNGDFLESVAWSRNKNVINGWC